MATAAASGGSYASGNSAATPAAFNEADSSKAMASCAGSSPRQLMLGAFVWDQCTASGSPSTLPTPIRVSMGSWAFMLLSWLVVDCIANPARRMTREPARGAVAWVNS